MLIANTARKFIDQVRKFFGDIMKDFRLLECGSCKIFVKVL